MGMYDTIKINLICPNCGELTKDGVQTKDLSCTLDTLKVGDKITNQYRWLMGTASCRSEVCREWKNQVKGNTRGFGYLWDIHIFIDEDGAITNKTLNIDTPHNATALIRAKAIVMQRENFK